MSMIRTGVFISCCLFMLPADPAQREQVIAQASQTVAWARTYCEREPVKCEQAAGVLHSVKDKAFAAARISLDAYQQYATPGTLDGLPQTAPADATTTLAALEPATQRPLIDTLSREDLAPGWRGPKAR
jgi:hypothetical protein